MSNGMSDTEQLVQRFVDQELSADERVRFVARLGRDGELREQVLEMEQMILGVSRLPRRIVPGDFTARVLERTASSRPSWKRVVEALWTPRHLQWHLAGAAAAACLLLLAMGGVVATALRWRPVTLTTLDSSTAETGGARPGVLVRLVVVQPGARMVHAAGDFNGWNPARTPLEQAANGAWTVTIPLEPGRYEYMFVVDGDEWVGDPLAAEQNDDGFGSRNAVLDVRPPVEAPL